MSIHIGELLAGVEAKAGADHAQDKGSHEIKLIPQPPPEPTEYNRSCGNDNLLHIV
ncbi:MAG: hypothetical protein ABIJ12_04515 [bacterium]